MQWEYEVYYVYGYQDRLALVEILTNYGLDRWELVTMIYYPEAERREFYFKRELLVRI